MKRLLATLAILIVIFAAVVALVAADDSNRPEGPAERWMAAISRDTDTGAIARFGDIGVAEAVLGFDIDGGGTTDRKHIDRFEIGPASVRGDDATVPVQVWSRGSGEPAQFSLGLTLVDGAWRVTSAHRSDDAVVFPSDGGRTYGTDTSTLVLVTLVIGLVVFAAAVAMVRIAGARPLHMHSH